MVSDDKGERKLASLLFWTPDHMRVQEEEWAADANIFISQEEDDTQAYSVRVAIFELLTVCDDQGLLLSLHKLLYSSLFSQLLLLKQRPRYTLLSSVLLLRPTKLENLALRTGK